MALRHDKGLCYNCEEKRGPNHCCKAHFFLLIAKDEDIHPEPPTPLLAFDQDQHPIPSPSDNAHAQISFNALFNTFVSESLCLYG